MSSIAIDFAGTSQRKPAIGWRLCHGNIAMASAALRKLQGPKTSGQAADGFSLRRTTRATGVTIAGADPGNPNKVNQHTDVFHRPGAGKVNPGQAQQGPLSPREHPSPVPWRVVPQPASRGSRHLRGQGRERWGKQQGPSKLL